MSDTASGCLRLTPFLEPEDPEFPDGELFVAGFRDENGSRWGALVPLERGAIERVVLDSICFYPHMKSDGTVQPWPEETDDEAFTVMLKAGQLRATPVDELVDSAIDDAQNEPNEGEEGVLPELTLLRDRLQRALEAVEAELRRRSREG